MKIGGLRTDEKPVNFIEGAWIRARNILINKGFNAIANEAGFDFFVTKVNGVDQNYFDASIIGAIPISDGSSVLFFRGTNIPSLSGGEIGLLKDKIYTTILTGDDPNGIGIFTFLNPIEGVYKVLSNGDIIIAWWDGIKIRSNPPYILNITNLPFLVDPITKGLINPLEINLMKMFPNIIVPEFELIDVYDSGGELFAGMYWFTVAYEIGTDDLTNYVGISRGVPAVITAMTKLSVVPFVTTDYGNEDFCYNVHTGDGQLTNKSIKISINGLDTRFKHFRLIAIRRSVGVVTPIEIGKFPTQTANFVFTYTGQSTGRDLSNDEVLIQHIAFSNIKTGCTTDDELFVGTLKTTPAIDYQKFANNIKVDYIKTSVPNVTKEEIFREAKSTFYLRGVCPDEVMALYIGFVLNDGTLSEEFHIPGRRVESMTVPNPDIIVGNYDSALTVGADVAITVNNFGVSQAEAIFGFQYATKYIGLTISVNGFTYPIVGIFTYSVSANRSVTIIMGGANIANVPGSGSFTVQAPSQVILENELVSNVTYCTLDEVAINPFVKYFHVGDTSNNPTAVAGTPIQAGSNLGYWENQDEKYPDTDDFDVWGFDQFFSANTVINYSQLSPINPQYRPTLRNQLVRHHKFPPIKRINNLTGYSQESIGINVKQIYIPPEIRPLIQGVYISYATRTGTKNRTVLGYSPMTSEQNTDTPNILQPFTRGFDFTLLTQKPTINPRFLKGIYRTPVTPAPSFPVPFKINNTIASFVNEHLGIQIVRDTEYLPEANANTNPSNDSRPECILFRHGEVGTTTSYNGVDEVGNDTNNEIQSHTITQITNFVANIFTPFFQQPTATAYRVFKTYVFQLGFNTIFNLYSFDTFIGHHLVKIYEPITFFPFLTHTLIHFPYMVYSSSNIAYRQKDHTSWDYVYNHNQYNNDYSSVNNIKGSFTYNPFYPKVNQFLYRIARSNVIGSESLKIGWRIFRADRYYDMPNNKGSIWKLSSYRNGICINMEQSLFVAQIKDKLSINVTEVYLGSGDIFGDNAGVPRKPDEVLPIPQGYVGCSSQWATCTTPHGFVFIDKIRGKIFLFNGELAELNMDGMGIFFRENLNTNIRSAVYINLDTISNLLDNPFTFIGLCAGYDEKFDRLIISKRQDHRPSIGLGQSDFLTMSYNFKDKKWVCKHDYSPSYLYNSNDKLICIVNRFETPLQGYTPEIISIYSFNNINKNGRYTIEPGTQEQKVYPSYVDIVYNTKDYISTNFDVVNWVSTVESIVEDPAKVLPPTFLKDHGKTITHIMIYNDRMCTGLIPISFVNYAKHNTRDVYESWFFNRIRDAVINKNVPILDSNDNPTTNVGDINTTAWFKRNKFLHKFVIVRFFYDNAINSNFYLHDANVDTKPINR